MIKDKFNLLILKKDIMIAIQDPKDLLSVSLKNILSYRDDDEFNNLVEEWKKIIIIELEEFYPVAVIFNKGQIRFEFENLDVNPDIEVKMNLNTLLDIAFGRLNLYIALLKRKMKIKGIYKIKTLLEFKKIFLDSIKMIASDPNENYYELKEKK